LLPRSYHPAISRWTDDYLAQKIPENLPVSVEQSRSAFYGHAEAGWSSRRWPFREFLANYSVDRVTRPYLNTMLPRELMADFLMPGFVPCLRNKTAPFFRHTNMWMGYGGEVSRLHNDLQDNIITQIAGTKVFTLFHPNASRFLYEIHGTDETETKLSMFDPDRPDFERFPLAKTVFSQRIVVVLRPGDSLYIPAYWWHQVASHCRSIAVNVWWDGFGYELVKGGLPAVYSTSSEVLAKELRSRPPLCPEAREAWEKRGGGNMK
jgi:hypothetical protein